MNDENLKGTLAENLARFRKNAGLTQTDLAEKINYSDKSVSKWERGDGVPDITVLMKIAEVCNTTVSALLGEEQVTDEKIKKEKQPLSNSLKIIITAISVLGVWLLLSITYFVLHTVGVTAFVPQLIFICALPVSFLVLLIFSCIWSTPLWSFLSATGLVVTILVALECFLGMDIVKALIPFALILEVILALVFIMIRRIKNTKYNKV